MFSQNGRRAFAHGRGVPLTFQLTEGARKVSGGRDKCRVPGFPAELKAAQCDCSAVAETAGQVQSRLHRASMPRDRGGSEQGQEGQRPEDHSTPSQGVPFPQALTAAEVLRSATGFPEKANPMSDILRL